ncbi:diguanylate cyclase [Deinococcus roseus]|uniref:Sensor histidine kinase n=1 Tax=Deinococcus roseus TaxID=392414 RepID=A0ABQ2DCX4_9DEIO|nr:diguanylate cyclase [Deinococcus roseus]GGJ53744.1 sensor histidine kinase [Deinococcus roseus]
MRTVRSYILQHKVLTWVLLVFAAVVVLLGNLLNSYYTLIQERYTQEQNQTQGIMEALLNLETGSRGYVITGKTEFLEPFELGKKQFPSSIADVQTLILDGPRNRQQDRLKLLQDINDAGKDWLQYAKGLQQLRAVNFQQAQRLVTSNAGKRRMDHLRLLMAQLQTVQMELLTSARNKSQSTLRIIQISSLLGMLLAALAALWQGLRLASRMTLVFQRMLQGTRAITQGDYSHQVPTHVPFQEARLVAEDFNHMAQKLVLSRQAIQDSQTTLTHNNLALEKINSEITRLSSLSDQLQTCLTLQEAYHTLTFLLPDFLPGSSGEVMLFNASRNQLSQFVVWGNDPLNLHTLTMTPSECFSLRIGQPYEVHPDHKMMPCPFMGETQNYQCVPMLAQGDTVGIFRVKNTEHRPDQNQLTRNLAKQLALAIANLQLREALRNQSIRDGLTGVYNRRYFEEAYQRELDRTARHLHPLGVLMLDVDHFKRYNDTHGHEAGDAVLKSFGQLLGRTVRSSDLVCRYGGEEFVVLLPETDLDTALKVAEKIRTGTEQMQPLTQDGLKLPFITVSVGVASTSSTTGETLLSAADQALYASKKAGRNRVTAAS